MGALIAGGVWYQQSASGPAPDISVAVADVPAASAPASETGLDAVQDVVAAPTLDRADQEIAAATAPATPTTCEGLVGQRISLMDDEAERDEARAWVDYRGKITSVVQQILNCPAAGLDVVGSLELLDKGLADLHVSWDAASHRLTLTTIADGGAPLPEGADNAINFVLR